VSVDDAVESKVRPIDPRGVSAMRIVKRIEGSKLGDSLGRLG
jgi:hypothetical protein